MPGRFHISFVLSAIAWGLLLVLGGLGPLKSLVAEVQAWLSPIFCAAGDHLQAFHRCVGPGAPGGNATVAKAGQTLLSGAANFLGGGASILSVEQVLTRMSGPSGKPSP